MSACRPPVIRGVRGSAFATLGQRLVPVGKGGRRRFEPDLARALWSIGQAFAGQQVDVAIAVAVRGQRVPPGPFDASQKKTLTAPDDGQGLIPPVAAHRAVAGMHLESPVLGERQARLLPLHCAAIGDLWKLVGLGGCRDQEIGTEKLRIEHQFCKVLGPIAVEICSDLNLSRTRARDNQNRRNQKEKKSNHGDLGLARGDTMA